MFTTINDNNNGSYDNDVGVNDDGDNDNNCSKNQRHWM